MQRSANIYPIKLVVLTALILIEILAHNYWTGLSWNLRTLLFYVAGFSMAILSLLKIPQNLGRTKQIPSVVLCLGFLTITMYFIIKLTPILHAHPINVASADMLPVIQIMTERYLAGSNVYAVIPSIWEGTDPIYLPAMWMPYLMSNFGDFDMRWVGVGIFILGLSTLFLVNIQKKVSLYSLLPLIPIATLLYTLLNTDHRFISQTEEPVVAGYFIFLAYCLYKKNNLLIAVSLSLCLLSRYSLLIWSVMALFYIFRFKSRKDAKNIFLFTTAFMLFLMIISQGIWNVENFISLPKVYGSAILNPELQWKYEPLIQSSLGLAKYFRYEHMDVVSHLFKITFFIVPFLCLLAFRKWRKYLNEKLFLLCSLKSTLVFFYGFLIMPFKYLFFTSIVLSIAILTILLLTDREHVTDS